MSQNRNNNKQCPIDRLCKAVKEAAKAIDEINTIKKQLIEEKSHKKNGLIC